MKQHIQIDKYVQADLDAMTKEMVIDFIVTSAIPIYTRKKPNPKSGRADCPNTVRDKQHFRELMKIKLGAAKTEEQRQKVIDHYKSVWSE